MNWFEFNQRKATQAASYLLNKSNNKMNYLKLIKLMYLLDRRAFGKWERPISGDKYYSMDHGVVVSSIYDLIKLDNPQFQNQTYWHQFIKRNNYDVELMQEPELDELSKREIELLNEIYDDFGDWNERKLVKYTHSLPEWQDPHGSSIPIYIMDIMKALKKSDKEIEEFNDDVAILNFAKKVLTK